MGELLSGVEGQFRGQGMGTPGATGPGGGAHGVPSSVSDALDGDLDAYLDRELFVRPKVELEPLESEAEPVSTASGSMRALLDLAEEESEWMETLPAPASGTAEPLPRPEEPAVAIPAWMRVSPGAKETTPFAAMLTPVDPNAVHAQDGTDAAGLPTTPWSVPAHARMAQGNLLPGIMTPPPVMPVPGAPLPPWAPQHAGPMAQYPQHGMPMAQYPQQWGLPVAAPPEPKRILGMRPGAFLGSVAVGTLAAGLLMVAGLHFQERLSGTPSVSMQHVGQGTLASGTVTTQAQAPGTQAVASVQAGGTAEQQAGSQAGSIDTLLPSGLSGTAQAGGTAGPVGVLPGGATGTTASPSDTSAVQQAASSVAGTVLSTAQGDVQAAANGLRPAQPTMEPASGPAVGGTTLTSGSPAVASRGTSSRKASAKAEPSRTAAVNEETDTEAAPAGEVAFDEAESDEESTASAESEANDAESGAEDARSPNQYSELDEDFARELGFTEDAEQKQADPGATRTVYIPPAPDAKEHLTPDDVKAVVVTNQPAITACIRQHAKGTPVEGGGRFMVRWSVLPSGDTASVAMDTDTLKATPLAHCIEDVVRRWKFPAHQVRMQAPIRFPFVF